MTIAGCTGSVLVGDGMLTLIAWASDAATLTPVQHILGSRWGAIRPAAGAAGELGQRRRWSAGPTPAAPADHLRPDRPSSQGGAGGS
ncbi:hypothetical protein [Geodermatophilus obscurus]|uniref:hypothetical protein n=1 Tax=Geodermatophilus obscurus TaxID=1861 RepID=UPI001140C7BA|nr:hypothetical protein [Geodermatophilus obscurus]